MALNKKGVFFVFVAIILTLLVLFLFTTQTNYRLKNKMDVIEVRIETIHDFIKSVEEDLTRALYISSYRAMLSMEQYITLTGDYILDVNQSFMEVLVNGTINKTAMDTMENATFVNWSDRIAKVASNLGINVSLQIEDISISHHDPWYVYITVDVEMNVSDIKGTAEWQRSYTLETELAIEGFEDPLYLINSFGRVTNTIVENNDTDFSIVSKLKRHINNSYYIASARGPSFLQRLAGNVSNSTHGIESIVNIEEFITQEIPTETKSDVDYIYFSNDNPPYCQVNETASDPDYDWFYLDNDHLPTYNATCV